VAVRVLNEIAGGGFSDFPTLLQINLSSTRRPAAAGTSYENRAT
jgi:hypothetical protein